MNLSPVLRSSALAALLATALSAHALDAYSNLGAAPNVYTQGIGAAIDSTYIQGFQFTATASGQLSGFSMAMNDRYSASNGPSAFTLDLYGDDGAGHLGSLLGSYPGMSTGMYFGDTASALTLVSVSGSLLNISSGTKYWAVASSSNGLAWKWQKHQSVAAARYVNGSYSMVVPYALAVHIQAVPEPAPLAALGLGVVALLRRRRK